MKPARENGASSLPAAAPSGGGRLLPPAGGESRSLLRRVLLHPVLWFAVAVVIFPYFMVNIGSYLDLADSILAWAMFALGFNFLYGHTGDLSFAHGGFFAIAAYTAGNLVVHYHVNFFVTILAGLVASGVGAVLVGKLVVPRTRGIYYAMVTLAVGELIFFIDYTATPLTNGENGFGGIPRPVIGPLNLANPVAFYFVLAAFAVVYVALLWRITNSPFGKVCRAIRENRNRPEFLGYDVNQYRFKAFVISALFVSFAGMMEAYHLGYVSPYYPDWTNAGNVIMMSVLGGLQDFFGPTIGALVFMYLQDTLSGITRYWFLPLGAVFVLFVVVAPRGIWGLGSDLLQRLRRPRAAKRAKEASPVGSVSH